jgi:hypothetical protein
MCEIRIAIYQQKKQNMQPTRGIEFVQQQKKLIRTKKRAIS